MFIYLSIDLYLDFSLVALIRRLVVLEVFLDFRIRTFTRSFLRALSFLLALLLFIFRYRSPIGVRSPLWGFL